MRPPLATAIRLTVAAFRRHNASRFGAAMAFYIVFSVAPILLIAIAVLGHVFGRQHAEQEVVDRIAASIGSSASTAIAAMIKDAPPLGSGWVVTTLGLMTLYFGLAGVYRQIDGAIQTIWHETPDDGSPGFRKRLSSMALVVAVGGVLLLSVIADAAIAVTARYAATRLVGGERLWQGTQLLASTLVLTLLFAAVFRYLPEARVTWRDVGLGAAVTAILFVLGKFALGIYLATFAVGSAFGAAGSIVVVMLWAYWSAQIFFLGLEFTHVYAGRAEPV